MNLPTPALHVRRAALFDLEAILDMMEAFNHHEAIAWTREQGRSPLQTLMLDDTLGLVLVGAHSPPHEDATDVAMLHGYAVLTWGFDLEWAGRDAFLTELYMRPASRGNGLGREMLAHIERIAITHDARALHLMVRADNKQALGLYLSTGFIDPERLLLTKPLSGGNGP